MKTFHEIFDVQAFAELLQSETIVIAGISGGADSMAMLHGLSELKRERDFTLLAVYVNHLVRGESSEAESKFVESFCHEKNILFRYEKIRPPQGTPSEQYFREERYRIFYEIAREYKSPVLALGHNLDDKIETFLFHLCRGTGGAGVRFHCVTESDSFPIIRPLWNTSRENILRYLNANSIEYCNDETNRLNIYTRNAVRNVVIPTLENHINKNSKESVARFIDRFQNAYSFLAGFATETLQNILKANQSERFIYRAQLASLHEAVRSEVLYSWVKIHVDSHRMSDSLISVLDGWVLSGRQNFYQAADKTGFIMLNHVLWVYPEKLDKSKKELIAEMHGKVLGVDIPNLVIRQTELIRDSVAESKTIYRDSENRAYRFAFPIENKVLYLRNRLPGDKISPRKKLKDFLTDKKVPFYLKDRVLLATDEEGSLIAGCWDFMQGDNDESPLFKKFL